MASPTPDFPARRHNSKYLRRGKIERPKIGVLKPEVISRFYWRKLNAFYANNLRMCHSVPPIFIPYIHPLGCWRNLRRKTSPLAL